MSMLAIPFLIVNGILICKNVVVMYLLKFVIILIRMNVCNKVNVIIKTVYAN